MVGKTGIAFHSGRMQPYTVWRDGEVLLFTGSYSKARSLMKTVIDDLWYVVQERGKATPMLEAMVKGALNVSERPQEGAGRPQ